MKTPLEPFLMVNPKSYLYGEASLDLAKAADQTVAETGLTIYFTCPYPDIRMIAEQTEHIIVTAQSMMPLKPGRGMGHLLPEAIKAAGAGAVVLNHAERKHQARGRIGYDQHCLCRQCCRSRSFGYDAS